MRALEYSTGILHVPSEVQVEPVIDSEIQLKAMARLGKRRTVAQKGGRNMTDRDFSGRIYCLSHGHSLYRNPGRKGSAYRYWTHGKCDCGTFRGEETDAAVSKLMLETANWDEEETVTTGTDPALELALISTQIQRVARERKDGWLAELVKLESRETVLKAAGATTVRVKTGRHIADVWKNLDITGQRRYLQRMAEEGEWKVAVMKGGGEVYAALSWQTAGD